MRRPIAVLHLAQRSEATEYERHGSACRCRAAETATAAALRCYRRAQCSRDTLFELRSERGQKWGGQSLENGGTSQGLIDSRGQVEM